MSTPTTLTLEETIRELAARGEISDISFGRNPTNTKWRAVFVPCSVFGKSVSEDEDPIKALMMALKSIPLKSKKPPTDRELDAAIARGTGKIDQATIDADAASAEVDKAIAATTEEIDDLM